MKPYPQSSKTATLSESCHPQHGRISGRCSASSLLLLALFLALVPTALASNTWYVDGVHGKNKNDCKSPQTACKTIGHAISLAHSGDSIMVAAATYTENLNIGFSLKIVGSGAQTTIIDGGGKDTVVRIPNTSAHVTLSKVTIRNGSAFGEGGGIGNSGTLAIDNSTISGNGAVKTGLSRGGGIANIGTLSISNSTISGNTASAWGGGIYNGGTLTIRLRSCSCASINLRLTLASASSASLRSVTSIHEPIYPANDRSELNLGTPMSNTQRYSPSCRRSRYSILNSSP
jgi:hypothetical protein